MSKKREHPLSMEFEVEGTSFDDDWEEEVVIPESREEQNLELVVELALRQYKMNCDDMSLMDPKSRIRVSEINVQLLNTAKDAKYKLDRIRIEREKLERAGKKNAPVKAEPEEQEEDAAQPSSFSRAELLEQLRVVK